MAIEKVAVLAIGPNDIRTNNATSRVFSSNIQMDVWSATQSYNLNDCVEYLGAVWICILGNSAQIPVSNIYWAQLLNGVHDGDIAIAVVGTIDIRQRIAGAWISVTQRPITITLADNQALSTSIFQYAAGSFPDVFLDYEIMRGNGKMEGGSFRILTDGTANINFSQEFTRLIGDPGVSLSIALNAGNVVVSYISTLQTSSITFKYSLRVW